MPRGRRRKNEDASGGKSQLVIDAEDIIAIGGAGKYWLTCVDVDESEEETTRIVASLIVRDRIQRDISSTGSI